ncbi:hypothetical protein C0J52_18183 [Blattella germanica]|nr:hypothetical protein C0J52_18183 [Blattella germanica]
MAVLRCGRLLQPKRNTNYATKGSEIEYTTVFTYFRHREIFIVIDWSVTFCGYYIFIVSCSSSETIYCIEQVVFLCITEVQPTVQIMPQGKLKVKTKLPAKTKPKKKTAKKGATGTKRATQKLKKAITKTVNAAMEDDLRAKALDGKKSLTSRKKSSPAASRKGKRK